MFFHASQVPDIKILIPHISNHGKPLAYFSDKRENVLVYLSNAVEKYCKEVGYDHCGIYKKWGSYGFTNDGVLRLEEYYQNATADTYKGVSGYIYSTNETMKYSKLTDIPHAFSYENPVAVEHCEFIADAYEALLEAASKKKIIITRYEENSKEMQDWIRRTIMREYEQSQSNPEYRLFLETKFEFIS